MRKFALAKRTASTAPSLTLTETVKAPPLTRTRTTTPPSSSLLTVKAPFSLLSTVTLKAPFLSLSSRTATVTAALLSSSLKAAAVKATLTATLTAAVLLSLSLPENAARAQDGRSAGADTLKFVLEEIYQTDPGLASERERLREINQGVSSARQETRPSAAFTANLQRARDETPVVGGGGGDGDGGGAPTGGVDFSTPRSYGVSFDKVLEVGPRFAAKEAAATADVYAARARYEVKEQDLLLAAVREYMALWRARELLRLADASELLTASELEVAERRLALGEGTRTDVVLARSNLAAARVESLSARQSLDDAETALATRLGWVPGEATAPAALGSFDALESGGRSLIEGHPEMRALGFDLDGAAALLRETRAGSVPGVSVTGSLTQDFDSGGSSRSRRVAVGVTLTAPLLRQGLLTDSYRARLASHRRISRDMEAMRRSLSQEVVRSRTRYLSSGERIAALEVSVLAAEEALQAVQEENRAGLRSQSEIISSERSLVSARRDLVSARHDRIVSGYERLAAAGRLEPEVLGLGVERYDPEPDFAASGERWQDYYLLREPSVDDVLSQESSPSP